MKTYIWLRTIFEWSLICNAVCFRLQFDVPVNELEFEKLKTKWGGGRGRGEKSFEKFKEKPSECCYLTDFQIAELRSPLKFRVARLTSRIEHHSFPRVVVNVVSVLTISFGSKFSVENETEDEEKNDDYDDQYPDEFFQSQVIYARSDGRRINGIAAQPSCVSVLTSASVGAEGVNAGATVETRSGNAFVYVYGTGVACESPTLAYRTVFAFLADAAVLTRIGRAVATVLASFSRQSGHALANVFVFRDGLAFTAVQARR